MNNHRKTLYLIDGTALAYRAYFAFIRNPLINSRGENTSATFGFTNALVNLIHTHSPDYIAVAFDTGKPTFRHEMYDQYKATRQKMPDEMIGQVPRVKQAVDALGITQLEFEGYEADDVIGTLACRGFEEGLEVYMVTGDKDFTQLVGNNIYMFVPMKDEIITAEKVQERYGFPPEKMTDLLGLMGDTSDNVPGIPKVGKKTARELLNRFGSLDEVLNKWEEIPKPSIRESVGQHRELALLSRKLVTIKTDVPIECNMEMMRFHGINMETSREFFREMEFTRLLDLIKELPEEPETAVKIVTAEQTETFLHEISHMKEIAVDLETTSLDVMEAEIVGISIAAGKSLWYVPLGHQKGKNVPRDKVMPGLKKILEDPAVEKIGHHAKYDAIILRRNGIELNPISFDTLLAAYVLDPGSRSYSLGKLADEHLNHQMQSITDLIGKGKNQRSFAEVDIESAARYSGDDSEVTLHLKEIFYPRLEQEGLLSLFHDIEMPLMKVLMEMEMRGVCLDVAYLNEMSKEFSSMLEHLERTIYDTVGEEFNINSPKQLGEILFEKIGLKARRKTKTGYSTDIDTLTFLSREHELPGIILEYRQLMKLKSTYIDALPAMVNTNTNRVHTSYNQAVTATGRLSSSDPNLQNIPIRTELGRNIRKAFIAPHGFVLLSADYSQIELRIMAHMSGDTVLKDAFNRGEDVHKKTASLLFGVSPEMVTDDQRRQAKTINFGVMYGMGAFSLSEQLGIRRDEARVFIDHYFTTHAGVRTFIENTIEEARKNNFVTTLMGRKRYVADIHSKNRNVAEFAKRTAINTPIQGSAADLIKVSMINLSRRLKSEGLKAFMILQVHDELVFEVAEGEIDRVQKVVKETMESALKLEVPLVVDIGIGENWLEAH
ncbi:MAG TPA: DNA polymerase I [Anaerolineae bacterium]|nr:DNA polymerase I [Anaerolineae bacterium]